MTDKLRWEKMDQPPGMKRMADLLTKIRDGLEGELKQAQAKLEQQKAARKVEGGRGGS
jgi:hypothetical protein